MWRNIPVGIPLFQSSLLELEDDCFAGGAQADVFRGTLRAGKPSSLTQIALKRPRVQAYGEANKIEVQKTLKNLIRELHIWHVLQGHPVSHPHILSLLGVIEVPSQLISFVSEYCSGTLTSMLDTLKGLSHIHGLSIVHGDLKSENVLVTADGIVKICDFGQSCYIRESAEGQSQGYDAASIVQATIRYACPEFFQTTKVRPTVFSDMWAFGCLALEILSQLEPYHHIQSEYSVLGAIKSGSVPSVKPQYPNAAGCLNDVLWGTVKQCWYTTPSHRPSSNALLESISGLLANGLVNPAAETPERPLIDMANEIVQLIPGLSDFAKQSSVFKRLCISSGTVVNVWAHYNNDDQIGDTSHLEKTCYIVKTTRLTTELDGSHPVYHLWENELRHEINKKSRLWHANIVLILGVDSSYGRHTGIVLEYCSQGSFVAYKNKMQQDEDLYTTYMTHILSGLEYLHNMIVPVAHGDLTPHNILVDGSGKLKLTSICMTRMSLDLSAHARKDLFGDYVPSARYMSPELLQDNARPTPASDMWSFGNVAFWIYSGLRPYPEHADETSAISQITRGSPPNRLRLPDEVEELGGFPSPEDWLWQTNGIWTSILTCWREEPNDRPTASQFLGCLEDLSSMSERAGVYDHWTIVGATDLTGRVGTSETKSYGKSLRWARRIWRGASDERGTRTAYIDLYDWKTSLSRGFFRRSVEVIVKGVQLTPKGVRTYAARQSIRHELMLLKQITHPSICPLLGFDQQYMQFSGVPGIVLEFCPRGTLQEYYDQRFDEVDEQHKITMLVNLAQAVHHIHCEIPQGSIAHGNLSMASVVVDATGRVKLTNFELACQYVHADNVLEASVILAPPIAPPPSRWHAPEFFVQQANAGWPNPTQFTDLWSLGCLIVAVWTNRQPYAKYDTPGALTQISSKVNPYEPSDCPVYVWEIVVKLWTDPFYYRISAESLLELLEDLKADTETDSKADMEQGEFE